MHDSRKQKSRNPAIGKPHATLREASLTNVRAPRKMRCVSKARRGARQKTDSEKMTTCAANHHSVEADNLNWC
jgi:hypothetical protein